MAISKQEVLNFTKKLEIFRKEKGDIGYIEAITLYCQTHNIEIEAVISLINRPLKAKIAEEAERLNLIKEKTKRLPI